MRFFANNAYRFDTILAELRVIRRTLSTVVRALELLTQQEHTTMATLADISAAVAANKDAQQSAIVLLEQLHAKLQAALEDDDPAAIQAIVDELDAQKEALAAAVVNNTPVGQAPQMPPQPPTER